MKINTNRIFKSIKLRALKSQVKNQQEQKVLVHKEYKALPQNWIKIILKNHQNLLINWEWTGLK